MSRCYYQFDAPNATPGSKSLLTGIRARHHSNYITANYVAANAATTAYIYKGDICGKGTWHPLSYPNGIGRTVTHTALYGPDVLDSENIRAVGNYNNMETGNAIGCLYEGPLDGSGQWTTLTPSQETVDTIAHSTNGGLVVGNYLSDTLPSKAFIYDIEAQTYTEIHKPGSVSTTAYGIWQNADKTYTICGGYSNVKSDGVDVGYIIDWDNQTQKFSNGQSFYYNNDPNRSIAAHFDGISPGRNGGYDLTGVAVVKSRSGPQTKAFTAEVWRKRNGTLVNHAKWNELAFPRASLTTGNSIFNEVTIGVYQNNSGLGATVHGFVSVPAH